MILGHATCSYLVLRSLKKHPSYLIIFVTLVGSYFPDFIDKPLNWFLGLNGRGFAHSLLFFLFISSIIFFVYKLKKWDFLKYFSLGHGLHLIQDYVNLPVLLYPFLGDPPQERVIPLFEMVSIFYTTWYAVPEWHMIFTLVIARDYFAKKS